MTDEELIARLRDWPYQGETMANAAADRIEALAKYRNAYAEMDRIATDALRKSEARAERLEAAGKAYREATRHLKPCPETAAGFDAALKGVKT